MSGEPTRPETEPGEPGARRRVRVRVEGVVQGVGFRPYVHRLAAENALAGYVRNDTLGVDIEAEGAAADVAAFLARLPVEIPPLATIDGWDVGELDVRGGAGFEILASRVVAGAAARVSPDVSVCSDCLRELTDPADRRFRYPFINCTNCGPRFTIVRGIPYDRPSTTMAGFVMCARCLAEYEDPANRRFHAQPNACPECGPTARLVDAAGESVGRRAGADAIEAAAAMLRAGGIVAVKGLGGYHLACAADDEAAVAELRRRKHREDKPFALMVEDLGAAGRLAHVDAEEGALLASPARPIVLLRARPDAGLAAAVAPGQRDLGLMLPYTPLHHLLLRDAGRPLVMTSGNVSDEPIVFRDADALGRLASIADAWLMHDRPIETRTEDSIVRLVTVAGRRQRLTLRRSRGYVPDPFALPFAAPRPTLGCGAELKNTFCLAAGSRAWTGPHLGDLRDYEALRSFVDGIDHFERLVETTPDVVAHDLHPEYLSSKYAADRPATRRIAVQHHHAHLAACLAEHGVEGPVAAAVFDGAGLGPDGTVWGGEFLVGTRATFRRVAHLRRVRLPGGDAAVREPWRMACSWLTELAGHEVSPPEWLADRVDRARWEAVATLATGGLNSPLTSSVGRLFDAVSALCGVRLATTYEGQAAIELEMAASAGEGRSYEFAVRRGGADGALVLDPAPALAGILVDLAGAAGAGPVSARFHAGLAAATAHLLIDIADRESLAAVVLSGGVFQNVRLLEATAARLHEAGLDVLVPVRLPPGDGGIAFGQIAVASAVSSLISAT